MARKLKKPLALLVLAIVVAGGVFAQEKTEHAKRSWLSGELSLIGAGARYEFMVNEKWSLGANVYFTTLILWTDAAVNMVGRFYPWGRPFFTEIGLGFGIHSGVEDHEYTYTILGITYTGKGTGFVTMNGFGIVPGAGWKIYVGNPRGFYISPVVQLPISLGKKDYNALWVNAENEFGLGLGFRASFGIGFAF